VRAKSSGSGVTRVTRKFDETRHISAERAVTGITLLTRLRLDSASKCSPYVLMQVETLGDALAAGWRVHARCLGSAVDNTRSTAKCHNQAELDLGTLIWTRGRNMPLAGLRERMMCPRCGNRRVNLIFDPPPAAVRAPAA
jgi:hypothetical protein